MSAFLDHIDSRVSFLCRKMTLWCLKSLVLNCFGGRCVKFDVKNDTVVHTYIRICVVTSQTLKKDARSSRA